MVKRFVYLWLILTALFWLVNLIPAFGQPDFSWKIAVGYLYTSLLFMFTVALVIMLVFYMVKGMKKKK